MKIAMISNQAQAMVNFRGALIVEMREQGHDIIAIAPDYDSKTRAKIVALGAVPLDFSLSRTGMNPVREILAICYLYAIFIKHKPDICLTFFIKPIIYGTIAAWLAGVKRRYALIEGLGYTFTEPSRVDGRRWLLQRAISLLMRCVSGRISKVIFLNEDDRDEFLRRQLVKQDQAHVLGAIGLDLREWPAQPLPVEPVVFIMVARLLRDKGIREYVAAAERIKNKSPSIRFILVGGLDENLTSISKTEIGEWTTRGLIEWPGHVPVREWLVQSSVFVLPSYREGLPRSTQEAMALGRPVITTDVPGCRQTVVDGRNGILVPVRDVDALVDAMRHFIRYPESISLMGAESRKIAEECYDAARQNLKLMRIMDLSNTELDTRPPEECLS